MSAVANITLDGQFTDWTSANSVATPGNTVPGYNIYGALVTDPTAGVNYVIGIQATDTVNDPIIGLNTTIWLNSDQNTATGFSPIGAVGAEYYINFAADANGVAQPHLYSITSAGVSTLLNNGGPLFAPTYACLSQIIV